MRSVVYTDIARDGMQTGIDVEAYARMARESGVGVTVSGGVVQLGLRGVEDKKIPVSRRRVVAVKRMLGL